MLPCGFLFNFSKVTENAIITITIDFFSTSDAEKIADFGHE